MSSHDEHHALEGTGRGDSTPPEKADHMDDILRLLDDKEPLSWETHGGAERASKDELLLGAALEFSQRVLIS